MRRALLASGLGLCLACGGGDAGSGNGESPTGGERESNRPPYVEFIAITPERPTAEDALTAGLRVLDPDRDPLTIELVWYRNGSVHDDTGRQSLDPGELVRDDRVWFEALISDGSEEIVAESDPVTIANARPHAGAIRITPAEPTAADMLEVEVQGGDADGDPVRWSYRWTVDGVFVEGADTKRLPAGRARRGASVVAEVSGNDGHEDGEWTASETVVVRNAAPKLLSDPVYGLRSPGRYVYEVRAEDPDGDELLRYELAEGPPGMTIDPLSGVLSWTVPRDAEGEYPIEIAVSDAHGGRAQQRWALQVSWQPADHPGAKGASPSAPAAGAKEPTDAEERDDKDVDEFPASESEDALGDDGLDDDEPL